MILTIDIGNSLTHAGIYDSYILKKKIIFPTQAVDDSHDLPKEIIKLSSICISNAGISSVVPKVNVYWKYLIKKYFDLQPVFISNKIRLPIKLKIYSPGTVGSDRICNAAAGYKYFGRKHNVIIIDFGTATTYDIVLKSGEFIGGVIAPGIGTSAESIHTKTSKLPLIPTEKLIFPKNPAGRNTLEAMQSGIMYSTLDSMEGMVKRLEKTNKVKFKIILTGGFAPIIQERTVLKTEIRKDLVMEGINYILHYNNAE
jgi:type III pantothenate kinase